MAEEFLLKIPQVPPDIRESIKQLAVSRDSESSVEQDIRDLAAAIDVLADQSDALLEAFKKLSQLGAFRMVRT